MSNPYSHPTGPGNQQPVVGQYPPAPPPGYPAAAGPWQQQHPPPGAGPDIQYEQQQQYLPPGATDMQYQQQQAVDGAAPGPDGSRGLGTALLNSGHKMHKVGLAMHHIAHPVQGLKHHTVDKVKRKMKAKACHLVDKVMP